MFLQSALTMFFFGSNLSETNHGRINGYLRVAAHLRYGVIQRRISDQLAQGYGRAMTPKFVLLIL